MKTSTPPPKNSIWKYSLSTVAMLTFFSVLPSSADDIPLLNFSFESPAITANTEQRVTPTDWTLTTGASYIDNGTAVASYPYGDFGGPAPDGQQVADIGNANLFQNTGVALVTGTTYTLSFYAATNTSEEFFGGLSAADDTTSEGTDFGYESFTVSQDSPFALYSVSATYTGPGGQYLTAVIGDNSGGYSGFDSVSLSSSAITDVPEPSTKALFLIGIAVVVYGIRRKIALI